MISKWLNKIIGGVVALVISMSLLPVLQDGIDDLIGTSEAQGIYYDTAIGSLLNILPMILVVIFVILAVTLIPKSK